jgi:hypothetical protein
MVALIACQPAFAADTGKAGKKGERKICKSVQETGSRMGNIRACMTKAQWRAYYKDNRWEQANGEVAQGDLALPVPNTAMPR